jgi:glucosylceramidase
MPTALPRISLAILLLATLYTGAAPAQTVHVFYTDNSLDTGAIPADPVHEFPQSSAGAADTGTITLNPATKFQTMVGVGAAFSEIGSLAFLSLPADQQAEVIKHLFDVKDGAGFAMCRLPVGSSDFATSAYSYDDKPGDFGMDAFTLARDEKSILPVAEMAVKADPELHFFASPWSPPGWMKVSGTMDKGGPGSKLIDDDKIYKAYALYFQKYLQGYLAHGVLINRLCPQNEMDADPHYPGCVMPPEQMTKLVGEYLAPQFKTAAIQTEIWPGTFREKPEKPWAATCMKDDAFRAAAVGLGVQYCNGKLITALGQTYPGLKFMYTEAPCENGKNTVPQARNRLSNMIGAFSFGCDSYAYWNMILDEKQSSGWGWAQNSLVTIDRTAHTVRYNADYQPMYLVSKFLRPGDVRIDSNYKNAQARLHDNMAFLKPDGSYLILAQNQTDLADTLAVSVGGKSIPVTLPAHADCAITLTAP